MKVNTIFILICLYSIDGYSNACPTELCPEEGVKEHITSQSLKSDETDTDLYVIDHTKVVYNDARLACKSHGLVMATIKNAEENGKAYLYFASLPDGDYDVWTAGNDIFENGNYIWGTNTNSTIKYFDWIAGSPPNDPNCGCISFVHKNTCEQPQRKCRGWQESKCNEKRKTLCMLV